MNTPKIADKDLDISRCEACDQFRTLTKHHVLPNFARQKLMRVNEETLPWEFISLCGGCHYELHYYFSNMEISKMDKQQQIQEIRLLISRMQECGRVSRCVGANTAST